jgi:hypothetical protein
MRRYRSRDCPSSVGPNRLAVGFRLLARNLALGYQLAQADGKPRPLAEPRAFAAAQVDGLGTFVQEGPILYLRPRRAPTADQYYLPWSHQLIRLAG